MNVPLEKYLSYEQYDEAGNQICDTYFFFQVFNAENVLYVIRMPEYAGQEETIPEEMKVQGAFARDFGKWYFRITEEQYDRISQPYWDAYDTADEKMKEVTYTYEEFMGLPMP